MCSDKNHFLHMCQFFSIGYFFYKMQDNILNQDSTNVSSTFIRKMTLYDDQSKEANRNEGSKEKGKVNSKKSASKKKNKMSKKPKKKASKKKGELGLKKHVSKKKNSAELMSTFFDDDDDDDEEECSEKIEDDDEECSDKNEDDEDTEEFYEIDKLCEAKKDKGRWLIKLFYVGYDEFYWQPIGDLSESCSK